MTYRGAGSHFNERQIVELTVLDRHLQHAYPHVQRSNRSADLKR